MWALGVLAEIGVFLIMPGLAKRFGMRAILLFSLGAVVLRFLVVGWGANSFLLLFIAQLLHGVTFGAYHAAAIAMVNRWFPGRLQAQGQALYGSLSFGAGGMLGGLLSGVSWDTIGAAWTFTLGSSFGLAGLIWLMTGWRGTGAESEEGR
jgi:MFS transporter, PPP family, 3-phenylpropionic acid transporter